ncbi:MULTISPECIES: hypothetical protein [unclassified Streptomyces]|uniref:hypothetical protein n=1 Tax=unclassified Streptomyces TaxID=2593676 RepID=UPI00166008CF|nr:MULTISPECIES: hypothetical protein [unclassified Streptomyces]MBD0709074.1 hypothetical protein [Streptomyces sp. CBMA291]MBD0716224.1 hypothetical protein [Streptomyces sp. CBMA370]
MYGGDLLRYARLHRAVPVLAGTAVVAVLSALFGGARIALPSLGSASLAAGIPYRHELPLLSAVFLTAALGGAMAAHEQTGTRAAYRLRTVYCGALTLWTCFLSFATETFAAGPDQGAVFVRSLLIWFGLALVSLRLLGPQLGWALPLASALLLIWYPLGWWDWTANPAGDLASWLLATAALTSGTTATAATPWRLALLRGGCRYRPR